LVRDETAFERDLAHYEGLIFSTAQRYVALVEEDLEDLQQLLRVKVWTALERYDPSRSRMSKDRFVFMVVRNQTKDWMKRRSRGEVSIDELDALDASNARGRGRARDRFEGRYLAASHDETYGAVEDDLPLVPSTLTRLELQVVCLLYRDFRQSEVARQLGIEKREVEKAVRSIRTKMADWRPSVEQDPATEAIAA
jgi:RNA polymerase sigma factor (sigma-70 family)